MSARDEGGAAPPCRGNRGFTLLEVVVALAIFAAGILGLLELLSGSLRLSEGARDLAAAQVYASQRMEEALLAPAPVPGVERGLFGERYRWEMETSIVPPEEGSRYRQVQFRVTIRWDDGRDERSVDVAATRWTLEAPDEQG